jgi:hypothetical protein
LIEKQEGVRSSWRFTSLYWRVSGAVNEEAKDNIRDVMAEEVVVEVEAAMNVVEGKAQPTVLNFP